MGSSRLLFLELRMSLRPSRDDEIKEMTERNGTQKSGTTGEHVRKRRGPRGKANKVLEFFLDFVSLSLSLFTFLLFHPPLYTTFLFYQEPRGKKPLERGQLRREYLKCKRKNNPPFLLLLLLLKSFFFSLYLLVVLLEEAPQAADANTI